MESVKPEPSVTVPPLPEGLEPDWRIYVEGDCIIDGDGELVGATRVHLELWNSNKDMYRSVQYGAFGSEGNEYDAIAYYEGGGGGTAVLGFAQIAGDIVVGVVQQHRMLMGDEPVLVIAGGYQRPGEDSKRTGKREAGEELGNVHLYEEWIDLPGRPTNPNRAVWITAREGEGVKFQAVRVNPQALAFQADGTYRFREEVVRDAVDGEERVLSTVFLPAAEALMLEDALIHSAVGRLLVHLKRI